MAKGPRHRISFRRRREHKTNYYQRLRLLLSQKPRVVVRRSSRHMIVQLISPSESGDVILASATSAELQKFGYEGATGNTPAAYLTGLLFGLRALKAGHGNGVLDIGLHPSKVGTRIYAALKGTIDAGMDVPHNSSILPSDERIKGEHIAKYANEKGLKSDMPDQFDKTKKKILSEFAKKGE